MSNESKKHSKTSEGKKSMSMREKHTERDGEGERQMKIDDDEDHGLTTPNARIDKTVVAHRHHEHAKR